ncbi:hypothetical protein CGRA01v4_09801 [Colletotrichum graminicola]|nr:hypothetical protein CGRA01v4_09801 [Colletotrichum graminicola]
MQPWHGADLQPMNQPQIGSECFASARLSCLRTPRLTVADASNAARMIIVLSEAPSRCSEARAKTDRTYQGLFRNLRQCSTAPQILVELISPIPFRSNILPPPLRWIQATITLGILSNVKPFLGVICIC